MVSQKNINSYPALVLLGLTALYAPLVYAADTVNDDQSSITRRDEKTANVSKGRTNYSSDSSILTTRTPNKENSGTINNPDHGGPTSREVLNQARQTDQRNLRNDTTTGNTAAVVQDQENLQGARENVSAQRSNNAATVDSTRVLTSEPSQHAAGNGHSK